jgi:hypothetical protein
MKSIRIFLSTHAWRAESDAIRVADLFSFYWLLAVPFTCTVTLPLGEAATECEIHDVAPWCGTPLDNGIYGTWHIIGIDRYIQWEFLWAEIHCEKWTGTTYGTMGDRSATSLNFPLLISKGMMSHGSINIEKKTTKLTKRVCCGDRIETYTNQWTTESRKR